MTISVAYANNNVKIVGTAPGITAGPNGGTHMCFQDLAIMRAMPNMHVYSPCDAYELRSMLRYMASNTQPTYMQLIRGAMPQTFDESYRFDPNKAVTLQEGKDVTIVSTGYMTPFAREAAQQLQEVGIEAEVLHYPSVKPFDTNTLIRSAQKTGAVVTVETQNIIGGLGGAVCETLSENHPTRVNGSAYRTGLVKSRPRSICLINTASASNTLSKHVKHLSSKCPPQRRKDAEIINHKGTKYTKKFQVIFVNLCLW